MNMLSLKKVLTKILVNLNRLNGRITYTTAFSSYAYKGTKSNEWEYIGKSIEVPSGHRYLLRLEQGWASGKPIGLGVHNTNDLSGANAIPRYGSIESSNGVLSTPAFLLAPATYYVYTKRATVPSQTNNYFCYFIDITL